MTSQEDRVLVHAPSGRDGPLTVDILRKSRIDARVCPTFEALCRDAGEGAAALLVAEEALDERAVAAITQLFRQQATWSDLPVIVSTTAGATTDARVRRLSLLAEHGNVVVLERPVRILTTVATVRSAQRARRRQYQMRDLTTEAKRAQGAAESANRAKDEFLAMLGHELRNPLSPMLTALELMRLRGEPSVARERAVIERQAHHMAALVDDLLDVSRITRGKIVLRRQRVDLGEVIGKAIETSAPLLEQRRHQLFVDVAVGNYYLDGDPARLVQIFSNILTNAAKYTDDGGRIEVVARAVDGTVEIAIADNGRGIAPEMLAEIFGLFTQARQHLDRAHGGRGLGLAIVKMLVAMHGGSVDAESKGEGRGSRFVVRLPLAEAPPRTADASLPLERDLDVVASVHADRPIVLVVDDNEDAAEMLSSVLDHMGYATRVAHDGPAALAIARAGEPIHFGLLDIGLPVMDGYELARRLRELPGWENVWLAAITGYGQEHDLLRSREAGFQVHLIKPLDLPRLAAALDEASGRASEPVGQSAEP
jgi:signal transduction histidine kinase/ActR/RegA family two-component response regulator